MDRRRSFVLTSKNIEIQEKLEERGRQTPFHVGSKVVLRAVTCCYDLYGGRITGWGSILLTLGSIYGVLLRTLL